MLVTLQIPFADLRYLREDGGGRLGRPEWPIPADKRFVRNFGGVRSRSKVGLGSLPGEEYYASAANGLRFAKPSLRLSGAGEFEAECTFRRFFCDGAGTTRVEIGFNERRTFREQIRTQTLDAQALVASVAGTEFRLKGSDKSGTLLALGADLRNALYLATSMKASGDVANSWRLVRSTPCLLVECSSDQTVNVPQGTAFIELPELKAKVWAFESTVGSHKVVVYILKRSDDGDTQVLRKFRVCVLGLHAESETLVTFLREITKLSGPVKEAALNQLGVWFDIKKERYVGRYGFEELSRTTEIEPQIYAASYKLRNTVSNGFLTELVRTAEGLKRSIADSLRDLDDELHKRGGSLVVGTLNINQQHAESGGIIVSELSQQGSKSQNVHVGHDMVNSNVVQADTITNAFNEYAKGAKPDDPVTEQLKILSENLAEVVKGIPEPQAKVAASQHDTIVKVAEMEPDDRTSMADVVQGSINFLSKISKQVIDIGGPLVAAGTKVAGALATIAKLFGLAALL